MGRKKYNRIIALGVSVAVFFAYAAASGFFPAVAIQFHVGESMGQSDNGNGDGTGTDTNVYGRSDSGAEQDIQEGTVVTSFADLKKRIETGRDELYLVLGDDMYFTDYITTPENRVITIDGQNKYKIDQMREYRIYGRGTAEVTFKDMEIVGRFNYGILQSDGANGTVVFDNVHYSGPQPYYSPGAHGTMIIRNGGTYYIQSQNDGGYTVPPQELCENSYVIFDGGETEIYHSLDDANTNAVFFITNGTTGSTSIELINEAQVTITTGDYVLYTGLGAVPLLIGDGCSLDITAPAFNRDTGHPIGNFQLGQNASFSYYQTGSPNLSGPLQEIYVSGNVTLNKNSTFRYESGTGFRPIGTVTLNQPKLFSLYGRTSAIHEKLLDNDTKANAVWTINSVNAVNYWTVSALAEPDADSATNLPEYMWNSWYATGNDTFVIGEPFSFSGTTRLGVKESSSEVHHVLDAGMGSLASVMQFDATAKRIVIGNINPFVVEKAKVAGDGIYGTVNSTDIMVEYPTVSGEIQRLTGTTLPLRYGEAARPQSGTHFLMVANLEGLRAAINVDISGVLELVEAPGSLYYGQHEVPTSTTIYERQQTSQEVEQGQMLIQVRDSRREESGAWKLTLRISGQETPDKMLLPASAFVFRTANGQTQELNTEEYEIYSAGKTLEDTKYNLSWNSDQGLLVKAEPGQLQPGSYAAVLQWAVQTVPDEE